MTSWGGFVCVVVLYRYCWFCFFFFQAEDGIRDIGVTGVQTCALPILHPLKREVKEVLKLIHKREDTEKRKQQSDRGNRDWSDAATSQGHLQSQKLEEEIGRASCRERV